jgi:hypothetical protein
MPLLSQPSSSPDHLHNLLNLVMHIRGHSWLKTYKLAANLNFHINNYDKMNYICQNYMTDKYSITIVNQKQVMGT